MKITESQLRRIIRQEVGRLTEMPRGRAARPAGGPFTVVAKQVPAGFHASLYVAGYEPGEVAKAFNIGDVSGSLWMAHSKKGVPWKTADEAIESLYREVDQEAERLGLKQAAEPDRVRPNEERRLELLTQAVDTWDTIPVQSKRGM